jgi:hypothetical protein
MPGTIPHSHMNSLLVDNPRSGAPILHPLGTLSTGGGHIKRLPPRGVVQVLAAGITLLAHHALSIPNPSPRPARGLGFSPWSQVEQVIRVQEARSRIDRMVMPWYD